MVKFLCAFKRWKDMLIGDDGGGFWSVIEFFPEELPKIDKNKVEIIM